MWPIEGGEAIAVVAIAKNWNIIFEHFEAAIAKIFNNYKNISPLKSFWKTWICSLTLNFEEKKRPNNI